MAYAGSSSDPYLFGEFPGQPPGFSDPRVKSLGPRSNSLNSGEVTGVFVVAGQSNAANCGPTNYIPSNATKVDNLNIYDGGIYAGYDPLLGCENVANVAGTGNLFTRMADKLVTAGKYARVILAPTGIGGTSIAAWNTYLRDRPLVAARRLASYRIPVTAFLWMQGENDNLNGTSQAVYQAGVSSLISYVRAAGFSAPWLIGTCTYIGGNVSATIQAAQAALVNGTDIFAGANTDTLTGTAINRQADNTHLSAAGQDSASTLWRDSVITAL